MLTLEGLDTALAEARRHAAKLEQRRAELRALRASHGALLIGARALVSDMRLRLDGIVADVTLPRPGTSTKPRDREVWRFHVAYARRRDPEALARLVAEYLPRAEHHARAGTRRLSDLDDRLQVAREALVVALQRFDPQRRVPFQAFADATISGQLQKHIRDHGWLIRAPRRVHELVPAIRADTERLTQELGRAPTPSEVAAELGCDVDDVLMALSAHQARTHESLDALVDDDRPAYERYGNIDLRLKTVDEHDALKRALATISEDDRVLVREYFIEGRTQQEIAEALGRSQMHVSRRLRRVLRVLATRLTRDELLEAAPSN